MKKIIILLTALLLICACSGSDDGAAGPSNPGSAKLVFPDNNLECNQGTNITETESTVEFRWEASSNTNSYEVEVIDLISGVILNATTADTKTNITIKRATPYSWSVTSKFPQGEAKSETWKFYNAGDGVTSYAPFPAIIVSPELGAEVVADENSIVTVTWSGGDVDNDLVEYHVYTGITIDNLSSLFKNQGTSLDLSVRKGTTNYWKVVSIDSKGNTSESAVARF